VQPLNTVAGKDGKFVAYGTIVPNVMNVRAPPPYGPSVRTDQNRLLVSKLSKFSRRAVSSEPISIEILATE
jgi:hypothetical protein